MTNKKFIDKKIVLYNKSNGINRAFIYNFETINKISDCIMIIDDFKIIGTDLKIFEMDSFFIGLSGKIKEVTLVNEDV